MPSVRQSTTVETPPPSEGGSATTETTPPKSKRTKKAKASKPPKAAKPPKPKRTVKRFSLSAFIADRAKALGKPVDLALRALGDEFSDSLRSALGGKPTDVTVLDAKIASLRERLSALEAKKSVDANRETRATELLGQLDQVADNLATSAAAARKAPSA